MQVEWLQFVVNKAQKIYYYERYPRTDEQYKLRRGSLLGNYKKAKRLYDSTSDKKYKAEMKKIRRALFVNISKTGYEHCKKVIEEYKACYCKIIDEHLWNFKALSDINYNLILNQADDIEEAVEFYKYKLRSEEALQQFLKLNDIEELNSDEDYEAFEKFMEQLNQ